MDPRLVYTQLAFSTINLFLFVNCEVVRVIREMLVK